MKKLQLFLTEHEPIIEFYLQPSSAFLGAVKAAGRTPPTPIKVRGLIDTGFTGGLAVDSSLVKPWGLVTRNFNRVSLPREDDRFHNSYVWEVDLALKFNNVFPDGGNIMMDPIPASLMEFTDAKYSQALIGQEVLQMATFIYNGPKRSFSLAFPRSLRF